MNKTLASFPTTFETERMLLRGYQPGDGAWYYAMSLKNREHLQWYEWDNVAANLASAEEAETLVRDLAAGWQAQKYFFIAAFAKTSGEFVAQIYIGPVDWKLPEFEIGYFVEVDHEGQGFVTEAVKAVLGILFSQMHAHRVRLTCDQTNTRSFRVAERCHMQLEGCLRENRRNPDGTYSSSLVYSILESEYTPK